jgi:hypothetical protein
MVVTSDRHLLGRCDREAEFKAFLGEVDDLVRNIHGVAPVAELDGDEVGYLVVKVGRDQDAKVKLWPNKTFYDFQWFQPVPSSW